MNQGVDAAYYRHSNQEIARKSLKLLTRSEIMPTGSIRTTALPPIINQ